MVLFGTWYLLGVAAIVLIWLIFVWPAERRHFKRRLKLIQDRIWKREDKQRKRDENQAKLAAERRERKVFKRRRRFVRRAK